MIHVFDFVLDEGTAQRRENAFRTGSAYSEVGCGLVVQQIWFCGKLRPLSPLKGKNRYVFNNVLSVPNRPTAWIGANPWKGGFPYA
jgi:hypothetical protein